MKKQLQLFLLSTFFCALSLYSYGQNVDITWGKESQPSKSGTDYAILGEREGGVFIIKTDKKGNRYIDRFNLDDLSFDFSKDIELTTKKNSKKKSDRLDLEKILLMESNLIVFASQYDNEVKQLKLYARIYGFDGKPEGGWKKISKIQGEKKKRKGDFTISISEDQKFFVVEEAQPKAKKQNGEAFNFTVFDAELVEVYNKEDILLKFKNENEDLKNHKVGNDNRVYFISANTSNYSLYSFDVDTDVDNLKEFKIDLGDKEVIEAAFSFDKEGNILIVGFYTEKGKKYNYGLSGTFYVKLNAKTFEPILSNTNEFDKEFLKNFMSERKAEKGKRGIPLTFDMRNFVIKADGSVTVLAESRYSVEHCQSRNAGSVGPINVGVQNCYWIHHFNEVIVLSINPDGTTKYNQLIKKKALTRNFSDGVLSYSIIPTEDKLMVFYNDHIKNVASGNKKVRYLPKHSKRVFVMTSITEDGEKEVKTLLYHSKLKLEILPRNAVRIDNGMIIFGYYKKSIKLGRIQVN